MRICICFYSDSPRFCFFFFFKGDFKNKKGLKEPRELYVHAKSLQACLTLCSPMGYSPPGSSVHRILQTRILERVAMPSFRGSSQPRGIKPKFLGSPALAGGLFTTSASLEAQKVIQFQINNSDGICFSVSFRLHKKLLFPSLHLTFQFIWRRGLFIGILY